MLGRLAQGQRQFLVGADPQQALVAGAEVFGGFLRLLQLQVQVGQVVMGNDERHHRLVGVAPAFQQHLGQGQGMEVVLTRIDQCAGDETAVALFDRSLPMTHGGTSSGGAASEAASREFSGSSNTSRRARSRSVFSSATSMIGRPSR